VAIPFPPFTLAFSALFRLHPQSGLLRGGFNTNGLPQSGMSGKRAGHQDENMLIFESQGHPQREQIAATRRFDSDQIFIPMADVRFGSWLCENEI
jgi:hypothetical protein